MSDAPAKPERRACCLRVITVFVAVLVFAGFASIYFGNFEIRCDQSRASIARVLSDMRIYETVMQTYHDENKVYPAWSDTAPPLTTPIAYLNAMIPDPFSKAPEGSPGNWIHYAVSGNDFVIWSVGPDQKSQITGEAEIKAGYTSLLLKQYDATNGTGSTGDVFGPAFFSMGHL